MSPAYRLPTVLQRGILLMLCVGCGEPPLKSLESAPSSGAPPAEMTAMRFAGEVRLQGSLAKAETGSVFVIVRPAGARMPTLARKYEIGDPLWTTEDDARILRFALDERDSMGGGGAPAEATMELEARYDPDGLIETRDGIEKQAVEVRAGATDIAVTLRAAGETQAAGRPPGG